MWEQIKKMLDMEGEGSAYSVLGLPDRPKPSWPEVRKRYRELAMKWHPDKNRNNVEEATNMIKKINAAYDALDRIEKKKRRAQFGKDDL